MHRNSHTYTHTYTQYTRMYIYIQLYLLILLWFKRFWEWYTKSIHKTVYWQISLNTHDERINAIMLSCIGILSCVALGSSGSDDYSDHDGNTLKYIVKAQKWNSYTTTIRLSGWNYLLPKVNWKLKIFCVSDLVRNQYSLCIHT